MPTHASPILQHDPNLRAAARAIFEAVYPSDDWSPVPWLEAERLGTIHYRQAVEAARVARCELQAPVQPSLL
jgi:hypothetical protein